MIKNNTKLLKIALSMLAFIFGFSGTIVAQYGAIQNNYKMRGHVSDFENNKPLSDIKVSLKTSNTYMEETFTDKNGNFELPAYYWNFNSPIQIQASDTGRDQRKYLKKDTSFIVNYQDFRRAEPRGSWEYDNIYRYDINLKLKKELPVTDSIITVKDSAKDEKEIQIEFDTLPVAENIPDTVSVQKDSLKVEPLGIASHDVIADDQMIEVYPNPTNTLIHIIIDSKKDEEATLYLYDNDYNKLIEKGLTLLSGFNQYEVDMELYPSGNYLLILIQPDKRTVRKIIKL